MDNMYQRSFWTAVARVCPVSSRTVRLLILAVICSGGLQFTSAYGQVARLEVHSLQSMTLSDKQFLLGAKDGIPVTLAGELRIPRVGTDKLPAVVMLQPSGGFGSNLDRWFREMSELGVATFTVDSFAGRGIVNTVTDQDRLGQLAEIYDAYRALELLAKHPRIDANRIALMGFSRGGQAALYASMKRFQRMYSPPGLEFAAYLPFYAICWVDFIDDTDVSDKPIRQFHGAADDYVPVAPCRAYFERLRRAGKDVLLTEYPGAHHVFDYAMLNTTPTLVPQNQTQRSCVLKEEPVGEIINAKTGKPFTFSDPCVELGPHVAYDAATTDAAVAAVKTFLRSTFRLN
jgi:dienelactone hydrolase